MTSFGRKRTILGPCGRRIAGQRLSYQAVQEHFGLVTGRARTFESHSRSSKARIGEVDASCYPNYAGHGTGVGS